MIKFIHCADLHLDGAFATSNTNIAQVRRSELRSTFASLILKAKTEHTDFMFISGDLFDGNYVSKETAALLCHEFRSIPDCEIIISPGNHDPYNDSSVYQKIKFPKNVHIFSTENIKYFDFPEKNTTVYGYAFTSPEYAGNPLDYFEPENKSRINVMVAHADLNASTERYAKISQSSVLRTGLDYLALGHIHSFGGIQKAGDTTYAYSGCLEGRGFDETGEKGAIFGAIEKSGKNAVVTAKFIPLASRKYYVETLDVSGALSTSDIAARIAELVRLRKYGNGTALKIVLTGNVSGELILSEAFLKEKFKSFFIFQTEDKTLPLADSEKLERDPTLKGEFFRILKPMLNSTDEKERECAIAALRYGLCAIAGENISEIQ